jgi:hypothetical protein
MMSDLQDQAIRQHCKALRLPTIGSQFSRLAETAIREQQSHPGYLEALAFPRFHGQCYAAEAAAWKAATFCSGVM